MSPLAVSLAVGALITILFVTLRVPVVGFPPIITNSEVACGDAVPSSN